VLVLCLLDYFDIRALMTGGGGWAQETHTDVHAIDENLDTAGHLLSRLRTVPQAIRISAKARYFSFLPNVQSGSGGPPVSYSVATRGRAAGV